MAKPKLSNEEVQAKSRGALAEIVDFALHNKKWWLTPIVLLLLLVSALIVLGGAGVTPFIYRLF